MDQKKSLKTDQSEEEVIRIIDKIFERHGHIYDGLYWREQPKGTPMPQSLQNYFRRVINA